MTNIFRLFISSTFNDFRKEREVLQLNVFPKVKEYASQVGYIFQPIDLRWGISNEAQFDQKTLELCLNEVKSCKMNMYPNFLIMIGDRYGWIPLPYSIEENEFILLSKLLEDDKSEELKEWYKLDLNQIPSSYILNERKGKYKEFDTWMKVENRLREILQDAVEKSTLDKNQKSKYYISATESEVEEGILTYNNITKFQQNILLKNDKTNTLKETDSKHIFGFFRSVDKSTKIKNKFIVDDYKKAQEFKKQVINELNIDNTLDIKTIQIDENTLDEDYLIEFENKILKFLISQIDIQKAKEIDIKLTPLQIEKEAQYNFLEQKKKDFFGQKKIREIIENYIVDNNQQPLVIYGKSGSGKSSIMAKVISDINNTLLLKVVYRFISATPDSSSSINILTSILEELDIDIKNRKDSDSFEIFSQSVYQEILNIKENVIIFIDAVDQLINDDYFLWLPAKLPKNVKIIISALNDTNYKEDSKYFESLKNKTNTLHLIPKFEDPISLLSALLKNENRTIQPYQTEYFLEQFKTTSSPLYINIASQEIKNWKSDDEIRGLATTQQGIIQEFISNLSEIYHHHKNFVSKVLGFLYASRDGLSESELLQLISTDKDFIEVVAPQEYHTNHTQELPLVHWSRLYIQLKQFLNYKTQDRERLIYFFHREFEDIIKNSRSQKDEHEAIIVSTQKLIKSNKNQDFDQNRWGKLYAILITEYEVKYEDKEKHKKFAEAIGSLGLDDWIVDYTSSILDYSSLYKINMQVDKAIVLERSCLYTLSNLYKSQPIKWEKYYLVGLNNLALSYSKNNQISEAIEIQLEALNIVKELFNTDDKTWVEGYVSILINLAASYLRSNDMKKSIELNKEAMRILEELYKKDSTIWSGKYTNVLNNLAESYRNENQLDEAIKLQLINLEIRKNLYVENKEKWVKDYITSLSNLALSYSESNEIEKAMKLQNDALIISKELYKQNPTIWASLYIVNLGNLGYSYRINNQLEEAIKLQEQALSITKIFYLENESVWVEEYTNSLNNLATSYKNNKNIQEAIKLQLENLEITKKMYQQNKDVWVENYTNSLNNLALSYSENNQIKESISLLTETISIMKIMYQLNPIAWVNNYITNLNNLAYLYRLNNNDLEAIKLDEEVLNILKNMYKDDPENLAEHYELALYNVADAHYGLTNYKEATSYFKEYFTIRDFNKIEDIAYFIIPFIKWYQCELRLDNKKSMNNLNILSKELINLYKIKSKNNYNDAISQRYEKYLAFKDSDNLLNKEKYDIFMKFFFN